MTAGESFDLILLDLMMPGMNGFEVLSRLKADAGTRHIPVIIISALDELDGTIRCIEAGAEDYLPKPFNPVLLRPGLVRLSRESGCSTSCTPKKDRSEALLLNILPRTMLERMRRGETVIADRIPASTSCSPIWSISARSPPSSRRRRRSSYWSCSFLGSMRWALGMGSKK
jgi:adenylate cyclase